MLSTQLLCDIEQNKNIWIAYSGGVDSHVLLDLARQCFANVHAVHINHALNPSDMQAQQHCQKICNDLKIPLHCITVDARPIAGISVEAAARQARRQAWRELLGSQDLLLLAHHADDQAETIMYRLLRGTGTRGLSGMQQYSKVGNTTLMRPLLSVSKQEIISYAQQNNLSWLEDDTNKDNVFDRNYIRNQIMPLLVKRWPAAQASINRAGKVCGQVMEFVEPILREKLAGIVNSDDTLNLSLLSAQPILWQQELLRAWLQEHELNVGFKQLQRIRKEVIAARADARPRLVLGDKTIQRNKNKLYVLQPQAKCSLEYVANWDLTQKLLLPNGEYLTAERVSNCREFIAKLSKNEITVRQGVLGRKAKKIFQQYSVPPWERTKYPLVFANTRLVSIVGLWCTDRF